MNLAHVIVHGHTAYDLSGVDAKRFAPVFNSVEHLMARAPEILGTHYDISYPGKQLATCRDLRRLPLDAEYRAAGAQFGQFFGWERPLYFGKTAEPDLTFDRPDWFENVGAEVRAAHEKAAIFDASPFGKIDVTGPDAEAFLLRTCAGYLGRAPGSVIYTALLNERGTFESDLTAQRIAEDHYRLFVGTTSIKRDLAWFTRHSDGFDVTLEDTTEAYAVLGLMGPEAARIADEVGAPELNDMRYFKQAGAHIAGQHVRAARISYVGETGWEITCRAENTSAIYAALVAAGAVPAGLYAQTSMRIEKGFCAMGHELDGDVTPIAAGLDFAVRKTGGFLGAEALAAARDAGAAPQVITVVLDEDGAVPLGHEPIYLDGTIIGETSSAAYGYRIGAPLALGHVRVPVTAGQAVEVDIAGTRVPGHVFIGPAFDPEGARMRPRELVC